MAAEVIAEIEIAGELAGASLSLIVTVARSLVPTEYPVPLSNLTMTWPSASSIVSESVATVKVFVVNPAATVSESSPNAAA